LLPPMALIVVGLIVWIFNAKNDKKVWNK